MQRKDALLIQRLDRDKPHVRPTDGFTDRLGIGRIGLVPFYIWLDVLRWDQSHGMAETGELACPVVCGGAGLQPDQTRTQLSKIRHQLVSKSRRRSTALPASSTPWIWKTDFARSRPIVTMVDMGAPFR
jgi:hypothetical protein